jgi:hypothetical protein
MGLSVAFLVSSQPLTDGTRTSRRGEDRCARGYPALEARALAGNKKSSPAAADRSVCRREWLEREIPDNRLADLGYISVARVKQESTERQALRTFLEALAKTIRSKGKSALDEFPQKTWRKMELIPAEIPIKHQARIFIPAIRP